MLIGTGSEVHIAMDAAKLLLDHGTPARVVSMPSWELFDQQAEEYRQSVLPTGMLARVSVEAGTPLGWERYVGLGGAAVGVDHFGASAPAGVLYEQFGITAEHVAQEATRVLDGTGP